MPGKSAALRPKGKRVSRPERPAAGAADATVSAFSPAQGTASDLTSRNGKRSHAGQEVADHNAYLQALIDNNPLAIAVSDANGRIETCNPAFERLFGYHQAEILGADLDALLAPAELSKEAVEMTRRVAGGEVVRAKSKRRRSNGSLLDVQVLGVPLVVNGKRIGNSAMYEDITERLHSEAAHERAEERFRRLFENAVEGIFQTMPDGRLLSANPAIARMCGYSSPAELMECVRDVGKESYVEPQRREEFKRLMEEQGVVEGFEYQIRRKDGSKIWVSEQTRAVRDANGRIVSYDGTMED